MVVLRRSSRRGVRQPQSAARQTPILENLTLMSLDPPIVAELSPDSIHSPFFLTNGDKTCLSILSEVLYETNYDNWYIAMKIALDAKNKLRIN